jgi:outer membrane protein TolC
LGIANVADILRQSGLLQGRIVPQSQQKPRTHDPARWLRSAVPLAACCVLGACATYQGLKLPDKPALAPDVAGLRHDGVRPDGRLGVADIATLAVLNNPDLLAARAQHDVAAAQRLQAGLPPNPTVTSAVLPLVAGPATTLAWNAGLSEDLKSLITLSARRREAQAAEGQVDASILWQEWQTMTQAGLLAIDLIEGAKSRLLLQNVADLLGERSAREQHALAGGNATIATVAPNLVAWQAARTQLDALDRTLLAQRHQLAALLGLAPEAKLPLAKRADVPPLDAAAVLAALPGLAQRRPDLVALQLGYRAQDARLRAAILAQFPNLSFGVVGGSDNSNIRNVGPQITLELPVFDRNQGNIAIARATRRQLHDEYAARIAAADGQVRAMLGEIATLARQAARARQDLARLTVLADAADRAFAQGNLDARTHADIVSARLAREQEIVGLEQSLLEQQFSIDALTGAGMPPIALPGAAARS